MEKKNSIKESFVFYRANYDAIQVLSKKNQLIAYDAIVKYGLYREVEWEKLPKQVFAILKVIVPNIDACNRRYNNKVNMAQKRVEDFDSLLDEKVVLPKKKSSSTMSDNLAGKDYDSFEE